jgi:hypothetical protein
MKEPKHEPKPARVLFSDQRFHAQPETSSYSKSGKKIVVTAPTSRPKDWLETLQQWLTEPGGR